ncbi:Gfo/Idh/MocA family protein [Paenibacillus sp. CR_12]|uniref:Gfo/Idh/MocA family protein n=1 Tax=Paenibacillus sp. CR_12 TaxID=3055793 RepID=UPI0035BFA9CD
MKKIGFIDLHLDQFHANKYPGWIEQASEHAMKVMYAYGKRDKENGLTNAAWSKEFGIELLPTIEEVVERSDYLIVLSPDNPEFHEELSQLPLQSGKPTYIDKTFAPDRETAIRLFDLATKHGTPMYSTSALRFASEYTELDRSDIQTISSWGPGAFANYSIHQIEPIVSLMGTSPKRVMYIGTPDSPALLIDFGDGRQATVNHLGDNCPFTLGIKNGDGGFKQVTANSNFFALFIENLVNFFETGEPAVNPAETVAVITIIEYGLKAADTPYVWVDLPQ